MPDEQQHAGFVKSRTHDTCLVQDPVSLVIEGKETELSLADAKLLLTGLKVAIARVEASEATLKGVDTNYNLVVISKSGSGMSLPRSKLGDGKLVFIDGMPDAELIPQVLAMAEAQGRSTEFFFTKPKR